jgi:predicted O-methyltransferase YrrM
MAPLIDPASEQYALAHTTPLADSLQAAADWTATNSSAPQMMAGLAEARLLQALIVATGAKHVLEIGTFTGVGALSMAAALPASGKLTTLEVDPDNAAIASRHIEASPYAERIELIVGDARETLATLTGPFDLVWIDAWKDDYPQYFLAVKDKLAPGGVIAADNLFRGGQTLDPSDQDSGTIGIRDYATLVQADPEFDNVLLTIGDGVMLAWRRRL